MDLMQNFYDFRNRFNACGGKEAAMTASTIAGWIKFRECGLLLCGSKLLVLMK